MKQTPKAKPIPQAKSPEGVNLKSAGYPEKDVKSTGIKIRGTGAATKGVMARGPMA
jgi:hypothetical protein